MLVNDLFTEITQASQTILETESVTVLISAITLVAASTATTQNSVAKPFMA